MKTERRHELQTNVLADSLAHWIEAIKPYGRAILAGGIALVVAIFAWGYVSTQNTRRQSEGWNEYLLAESNRDPQLLSEVAQRYPGTMVAHWSRLTAADLELNAGTNQLLADRTAARNQLKDAVDGFSSLLLETIEPTILQRATYGLARAQEALGELEKARAEYSSLAEKWPTGPFAQAAKSRLDDLDQLSTKQFYDWLASYEPPAPLSKEPGTPVRGPTSCRSPTPVRSKSPHLWTIPKRRFRAWAVSRPTANQKASPSPPPSRHCRVCPPPMKSRP